ncbi:MAG TPA: hypothetical protein VKE74_26845 [Gemmataceae bacterium]|nr:hypothetical protein [Gemmataceae bacterium]
MAKRKAAKLRLIPEERLDPLRAEVERRADEKDYAFLDLCQLPYYHAIVYYMIFEHFRDAMREQLGGIDDDTALANAFFWYSVVFEYSHRIGPGLNPLAQEPTMDSIEGAPTLYFTEKDYIALIETSEQYVAAHPLSRAEKVAARKILSRCR